MRGVRWKEQKKSLLVKNRVLFCFLGFLSYGFWLLAVKMWRILLLLFQVWAIITKKEKQNMNLLIFLFNFQQLALYILNICLC